MLTFFFLSFIFIEGGGREVARVYHTNMGTVVSKVTSRRKKKEKKTKKLSRRVGLNIMGFPDHTNTIFN